MNKDPEQRETKEHRALRTKFKKEAKNIYLSIFEKQGLPQSDQQSLHDAIESQIN